MGSSQLQNGLREERMQMIVVDDFSALDNAGVGPGLRRSPSAGLCGTDRNKVAGFIIGKGVTLGRRDADFPVQRNLIILLRRRTGRHAVPGLLAADASLACLVPIE